MYDLSCDVVLFVADGFYGVKSPDRRVISGPIDGRACPGPERARNGLKRLRVFLHSKVCRGGVAASCHSSSFSIG